MNKRRNLNLKCQSFNENIKAENLISFTFYTTILAFFLSYKLFYIYFCIYFRLWPFQCSILLLFFTEFVTLLIKCITTELKTVITSLNMI